MKKQKQKQNQHRIIKNVRTNENYHTLLNGKDTEKPSKTTTTQINMNYNKVNKNALGLLKSLKGILYVYMSVFLSIQMSAHKYKFNILNIDFQRTF